MVEYFPMLKSYYKYALPLVVASFVYEEVFMPHSYLNKVARNYILKEGENAEIFLSIAGGAPLDDEDRKDSLRGQNYHNELHLNVY